MARLVYLFALLVVPAVVTAARPVGNPFIVEGRAFCDTCRAGFETSATTYLAGAKVRVECRDRNTLQLLYSIEGTTDSTGTYKILVVQDHADQLCDAVLVSSPRPDCAIVVPGRERARVILTRQNGIVSDNRFANAMGFLKNEALPECAQLLKKYQEYED